MTGARLVDAGAADVILVGVDAGATKTNALAVRPNGSTVGRASGDGANPRRQGLGVAADRISALVGAAVGSDQDHAPSLVYIAGAGINRPEQARSLEREVAVRLGGSTVMAANDTLAVLRVGTPDGIGIVVPVSTGANVQARARNGRVTDRGHGIFGGGFVLGALAARAARRGGVSPGLAASIEAAGLAWTGRRPEPGAARLAAAVVEAAEAGDPYPARMVDRWCRRVAEAVREEAERLDLGDCPVVIVYGGLLEASPWLGARIRDAVLEGLPNARLEDLAADPVEGAALLARDAWAGRLEPWDFVPRR